MPRLAKSKVANISTRRTMYRRKKKPAYRKKSTYARKPKYDRHMTAYHKILRSPFNEYVHPAPVPDGFGGRTVAMKLIFNQTITTDVNGAWAAQYFPSPDNFFRNANIIENDVPTSFNQIAENPQWTQYASSAFSVKPVCLGVKVSYTGRQELLAGLSSFLISNETTTDDIPAISSWGTQQGTHSWTGATRNRPIEAVSKLHDLPDFITVPVEPDGHIQSMSPILVGGSGYPASQGVVYVESVLYLEILPRISSALSFSEKPSGHSQQFHTGVENHIGQSPAPKRPRYSAGTAMIPA